MKKMQFAVIAAIMSVAAAMTPAQAAGIGPHFGNGGSGVGGGHFGGGAVGPHFGNGGGGFGPHFGGGRGPGLGGLVAAGVIGVAIGAAAAAAEQDSGF